MDKIVDNQLSKPLYPPGDSLKVYASLRLLALLILCSLSAIALSNSAYAEGVNSRQQEEGGSRVFVPMLHIVYEPPVPLLNPIDNGDFDNQFDITWEPLTGLPAPIEPVPMRVIIEEATNSEFTDAVVHEVDGIAGTWSPTSSEGKIPGTYYYRAKSTVASLVSAWSPTQSVSIYPLFVGLRIRWDGVGYVRGNFRADIGWHGEWNATALTEADTIRIEQRAWYAPNPFDLDSESSIAFYSATTGQFRSSNQTSDPSWKWGTPSALRYDFALTNDQSVLINGQSFRVKGPLTGYTTYGQPIQYWELTNEKKFLMHESGDRQQQVEKGDAVLRYHAGNTRFLIYSSVRRYLLKDGDKTGDTVHYITQLSSSNALHGSAIASQQADNQANEQQGSMPSTELDAVPGLGNSLHLE